MSEITFKSIADKYHITEDDVEEVFACYDTNDMEGMRSQISYCFFCMNSSGRYEFLFDIICYIKQCQLEVMEDE